MSRSSVIACVTLSLLSACRAPRVRGGADTVTPAQMSGAESSAAHPSSTLGVGDLLEVRVFEQAELSGPYRVSPDGTVDFPLCGKMAVGGLSQSQAADALRTCLANGYLRRPYVTVLVREYNSKKIYVFGEVQKPGTFPFDENMSVIQAITLAGGFTKVAAKNNTNVTRLVAGKEQKVRVPVEDIGIGREKNFSLQPGDIVFVPESFF